MFVKPTEVGSKMCPIMSAAYMSQPGKQSYDFVYCQGRGCMFWREGPTTADGNHPTGYCGYAPIAPHRDLTKRL